MKKKHNINHPFDIDREKLYSLVEGSEPTKQELETILQKARLLKGLTLEEDGVRMIILRTPQIAGATVAGDRVIVPVLIPLTVEIYDN